MTLRTGFRGGALLLLLTAFACDEANFTSPRGGPAPPRDLAGHYYALAVHLSWELDSDWRDEPFRVYGKRTTDPDHFLLAEVTSCVGGLCRYTDVNVRAGVTYEYFVAAVDPRSGTETPSDYAIEVFVPEPTPPPVPGGLEAVGLDDALYLHWSDEARAADDFHFYRVYLDEGDEGSLLLGETDSEGFLDLLVQNGHTYSYFVTSVDEHGHESGGSAAASATPRPDFHGELLYAYEDRADRSGFRFQVSEDPDPVVHGESPDRDFRLEIDEDGWWLVPGPDVAVHEDAFLTTALRCGPASDATCVDVSRAPAEGYVLGDVGLAVGYTYVVRMPAEGGEHRYGAVRVTHLGFAQEGAIVIFDWAHQLQPGNRDLVPPAS